MAEKGSPLATIFAEIDLDSSKFTRAQQQILKDASVVALDVEKNYQTLGIKSAAHFDLLRARAENAYMGILHSSQSTAADIIRAEEAKNSKMKALYTEQFGSQTTLLDKLKGHWMATSAAIASFTAIAYKGMEYMSEGAKAMQTEQAFANVAKAVNVNAEAMIADLKRLTGNTVDDSDLMQKAMKGMSAGMSPDAILQLAEVSRLAARRMGTDVGEAYGSIVDAVETMRTKALRAYGLITKDQQAIIESAKSAGIEVDMLRVVMENYQGQLEKMGPVEQNELEKMQARAATVKNIREEMGKFFVMLKTDSEDAAVGLWKVFKNIPNMFVSPQTAYERGLFATEGGQYEAGPFGGAGGKSVTNYMSDLAKKAEAQKMIPILNAFASWEVQVKNLNPELAKTATEIAKIEDEAAGWVAKGVSEKRVNALAEEAKGYIYLRDEMNQTKEVAAVNMKMQEQEAKDRQTFSKVIAQLTADHETDYIRSLRKINDASADNAKVIYESWYKGIISNEQYEEAIQRNTENTSKFIERAMAERTLKVASETAAMFEGIRGQEGALYEFEVAKAAARAQKYIADTKDVAGATIYLEHATTTAWIKMGKSGDDFFAGVTAGYRQLQREQLRWGEAGYQVMVDTSKNMSGAFSDIFYDGMKGELSSLADYWENFWNSMLRSFANIMGQMAAQWVLFGQVARSNSSGGGWGSMGAGNGNGGGGLMGMVQNAFGWIGGNGGMNSEYADYLASLSNSEAGAWGYEGGTTGSSIMGAWGQGGSSSMMGSWGPWAALPMMAYNMAKGLFSLVGVNDPVEMMWDWGGAIGDFFWGGIGDTGIGLHLGDAVDAIGDVFDWHTGKASGQHYGTRHPMPVPAAAFYSAPAFGAGKSGEFPAFVRDDEWILTPSHVGKLADEIAGRIGGAFSIGNLQVFLDGQEVTGRMKVVADGVVVERNKRKNLNPVDRVY